MHFLCQRGKRNLAPPPLRGRTRHILPQAPFRVDSQNAPVPVFMSTRLSSVMDMRNLCSGPRVQASARQKTLDKYMPPLDAQAGDKAFSSRYGFSVAEGPGSGLGFSRCFVQHTCCAKREKLQAGKRSAAGAQARAQKHPCAIHPITHTSRIPTISHLPT